LRKARKVTSKTNDPAEIKGGRSLRFHLIAAIVIYVIDGLAFGQGAIAFLTAVAFLLMGGFKTLAAIIKREPLSKKPLAKAVIYSLCFAAVVSTIVTNNKLAKSRAETVVSAVKQYKAKYRRYPNALQALVPEFLPSVPLAKYSLLFNDFTYWRRVGHGGSETDDYATLFYVAIPPFGRPTYNFEQARWGYTD
jgi:hypothetical protein